MRRRVGDGDSGGQGLVVSSPAQIALRLISPPMAPFNVVSLGSIIVGAIQGDGTLATVGAAVLALLLLVARPQVWTYGTQLWVRNYAVTRGYDADSITKIYAWTEEVGHDYPGLWLWHTDGVPIKVRASVLLPSRQRLELAQGLKQWARANHVAFNVPERPTLAWREMKG